MQSGPFIQMIAGAFGIQTKTVATYARALREAGLLSTGARGVNAPHMTPLDAARMTLAILTTDSPSECVDRVRRFGPIKYSPGFRKNFRGYNTMQPEEFHGLFQGETLEEVLSYMFGMVGAFGLQKASEWFHDNVFYLRITPFEVLAELYRWETEGKEIVGETVVPFKGNAYEAGFDVIKGLIRTERCIIGMTFLTISIGIAK